MGKFTDVELIAALGLCNGNITKTAEQLGVSRAAVIKRKKTIPEGVIAPTIKEFRKERADVFAHIQRACLQYITPEKLKKASLQQIGTLFGIMYDKERLEQNLSTENVAHALEQALSDNDIKRLDTLITERTKEKLEEVEYVE
jgi:hypothetical protein